MSKYWYELIIENYQDKVLTKAEIKCNSDVMMITDGYLDPEKAKIAAEYFIHGIKCARGEQ
jgi:hypothetical protein